MTYVYTLKQALADLDQKICREQGIINSYMRDFEKIRVERDAAMLAVYRSLRSVRAIREKGGSRVEVEFFLSSSAWSRKRYKQLKDLAVAATVARNDAADLIGDYQWQVRQITRRAEAGGELAKNWSVPLQLTSTGAFPGYTRETLPCGELIEPGDRCVQQEQRRNARLQPGRRARQTTRTE